MIDYPARVRGCLLGGAVGDALGAPVEFSTAAEIEANAGPAGLRAFKPVAFGAVSGTGLITDDTQMTLFTVEGIIRAINRQQGKGLGFTVSVVQHAYLRWLDTQQLREPSGDRDGWLQGQRWLYSLRAPGNTCMSALQATDQDKLGHSAHNNSKGCGGVMRSAPFGLLTGYEPANDFAYQMASEAAGFTHGHPTGQSASGALALLIHQIVTGEPLDRAVSTVVAYLDRLGDDGAQTSTAISEAIDLVGRSAPNRNAVERLGEGWIAEEALAIAVYCALAYPGPKQVLDALALAVTHSGDSDSTGAICGNILGALHGQQAIPAELQNQIEGRGTILELADDLVIAVTQPAEVSNSYYEPSQAWHDRYPGW